MYKLILLIFFSLIFDKGESAEYVKLMKPMNRILGGRPSIIGGAPYQAAIRTRKADDVDCGGSIISSRHILTAAHCVFEDKQRIHLENFEIFVGKLKIAEFTEDVKLKVIRVYVYPLYDPQQENDYDIAILTLHKELPSNSENIRIIDVATEPPEDETKCIVSGWGDTKPEQTSQPSSLLEAVVVVVPLEPCKKAYKETGIILPQGTICATNHKPKADSCQGDSGGPLQCNGVLYGVVSTGMGCGDNAYPGVYVDVAYYRKWIGDTLVDDSSKIYGNKTHLLSHNTCAPVDNTSKSSASTLSSLILSVLLKIGLKILKTPFYFLFACVWHFISITVHKLLNIG